MEEEAWSSWRQKWGAMLKIGGRDDVYDDDDYDNDYIYQGEIWKRQFVERNSKDTIIMRRWQNKKDNLYVYLL